ncbi:unnamed protein product, partial [Ranitomeya imitator]
MDENTKTFSPLMPLQSPIPLRGIDATPLAKDKPQYWTQMTMYMAPAHQEDCRFLVLHNLHDVVVLGFPWLQEHNPVLDWKTMSVTSWGCQGVHSDVPLMSISSSPSSEVPEFLSDFQDVFDEPKSSSLPPHRDCDCAINLIPGCKFPKGRLFNLSVPEHAAMRSYVKESLEKGHIRPSSSPLGAGFFFVAKKDGSLRPCIDYRLLNKITVKFQYPLPLLSDLFAQIKGASWFTKIDVRGAYNLVRIKQGDEWKTAFNTPEGHFEYLVMPFGLSNAPSVFQSFMHDIFRNYLDKFMVVYLDDILIFSDDWESHVKQVEVDASEIGAGAVLSQRDSDGSLMKPKFSPAERNYDVGNRELLAMKWAFEEWRHWLEGAKHRVVVLTDHKNLIYLESAKRLNPRQARWSLFFSRFDFVVSYLPGSKNVKADALSRSFLPDSPGVLEPVGILKEGVILSAISPDLWWVLREFQAYKPDRCPVGKRFVPDRWTSKTNGQTERTNQTLETYLRCFVSADQDDWVSFLPLAEFALNNRASSATLVSPFFCNFGFHPRFSSGQAEPSDCPGVDSVVDRLQQIWTHVVDNLTLSQEKAQRFANHRRKVWNFFSPLRLTDLGFEVKSYDNLKAVEILEKVHDVAMSDHGDADCFLCVFLSHGEDNHVYAFDAKIEIQRLTSLFKGDKCQSLVGKPKIFIIQVNILTVNTRITLTIHSHGSGAGVLCSALLRAEDSTAVRRRRKGQRRGACALQYFVCPQQGRAKYACAGAVAEDQKRTSCNIGGLSTALQNAVDKPLMPACRGAEHDEPVMATDYTDSSVDIPEKNTTEVDAASVYTLPAGADFIMCYSVAEGYYSHRETLNGSWYIQDLCEALKKYGKELEFTELLTLVNRKVSLRSVENCLDRNAIGKKQVPCFASMLTKKLYLRPKGQEMNAAFSTTRSGDSAYCRAVSPAGAINLSQRLTREERIEIVLMSGRRSTRVITADFNARHATRPSISHATVSKQLAKFRETGSVLDLPKCGHKKTVTNEENISG